MISPGSLLAAVNPFTLLDGPRGPASDVIVEVGDTLLVVAVIDSRLLVIHAKGVGWCCDCDGCVKPPRLVNRARQQW